MRLLPSLRTEAPAFGTPDRETKVCVLVEAHGFVSTIPFNVPVKYRPGIGGAIRNIIHWL